MSSSNVSPPARKNFTVLHALRLCLLFFFLVLLLNQLRSRDEPVVNQKLVDEMAKADMKVAQAGIKSNEDAGWRQWRGPFRTGITTEPIKLDWPADGLTKIWESPTGQGFSSVVGSGGKVYAFYQVGDEETLSCLKIDTGKEVWRMKYAARYRNNFGDGPRGTPTIQAGRIYLVGGTGVMHCLDAGTGDIVWRRDLLREFHAPNLKWGVSFSPLVVDNLVFINPGGSDGNSIAALDTKTGKTVWSKRDDPGSYSSPILATINGVRQVVFFTGSGLVGVVPETGDDLWHFPWVTDFGVNSATPLVAGDYVFISSGYGMGCALVKISKNDDGFVAERVYSHKKMANHFSTCVRIEDHVYGFHDTLLTCMSLRDGTIRWKERGFDKGSLFAAGNHLVVLGEKGQLALVEVSPTEYREKARFTVSDRRTWTMPTLIEGRLFVRDEAILRCYDMRP